MIHSNFQFPSVISILRLKSELHKLDVDSEILSISLQLMGEYFSKIATTNLTII